MNKEELSIKNKIYEETQEFGRAQFVNEIYKLHQKNKALKDSIKEAIDYINNATDWQWDNTAYEDLLQILERTENK